MPQATIVFTPGFPIDPAVVAEAWSADAEARELLAEGEKPYAADVRPTGYHLDPLQAVVIPLTVNVAADLLVLLITRLLDRLLPEGGAHRPKVDVLPAEGEDRIIAVTDKAGE
ncbi:hypothetical protein ACWT_2861 [Actinoplanes sp. SE50]|uniref:hypothetical protein n=1 Tax=unclassified Actinoplanes TaxID=2626549 RepID=UPI00023EC272|nr:MULTISPECIES: hypothetical protein [unclassified Actinoplanes]AEV83580.1 hypothetical protein ACPL_2685 [Actinoplanes sp. SE50/110]ATO82276.1 hypothetical protein ACWT_2861 [Actinoplanes sp. SE50]SLL99683.1 hypothetical protein ACSP50_2914 [Actinoplanes sp. SE50/110]